MKLRDFFLPNRWKQKAIKRRKELNSLKKRMAELLLSRDKAKNKNDKLKVEMNKLEERNRELVFELKKN